jgi:hypothetical protein
MKQIRYEDVEVGDEFRTQFALTEELVADYRRVLDWPGDDKRTAPPAIFANCRPWYSAFGGRIAEGSIHLRQKMEHNADVYVGDSIDVKLRISEKYNKKGRDYLSFEIEFLRAGQLACRTSTTVLWAYAG